MIMTSSHLIALLKELTYGYSTEFNQFQCVVSVSPNNNMFLINFIWLDDKNIKRYYPMILSSDFFLGPDMVERLNSCIKESFFNDKVSARKKLEYKLDFKDLIK